MATTMKRMSFTVDEETEREIREAAEIECDGNVSAWIVQAAKERALLLAAKAAVHEWEAEHRKITDEELAEGHRRWFA